MYDPDADEWTEIEPMNEQRSGVSCVAYQGSIFSIGGYNGTTRLRSAEKYNPIINSWTPLREMLSPRSNFAIEIIDEMIFAIGGYDGTSPIERVECYLPHRDEWLEATSMNHARSAISAVVVSSLPNVQDFTYKERDMLLEERRLAHRFEEWSCVWPLAIQ